MSEPFDISVIRRNLQSAMARKDIAPTTLSLRVGKSPTLVKDFMEKSGDPKASTLYRLADALDIPVEQLLSDGIDALPLGPSLSVKGAVAAGVWVEAVEWPPSEWQTMTGRPDVTSPLQFRYFLEVRGDSMNLIYPEGTFVECVSMFGGAEALPGKRVVVIRKRSDQMFEATVKELVDIDGALWATPRSSNPAHQAFRLDQPGDDIEEVRISAVVVSSVRPE